MQIRDITPADLSAIPDLNDPEVPHVNAMTEAMLERFVREATYFRVAIDNKALVGFLIGLTPGADYDSPNYHWFTQRYERFIYIDRIVVAAPARGQGLGQAFYTDLGNFSRGAARLLACEVNIRPSNEESLRFHRHCGFEEVGRQETEGGRKEVALMIKTLVEE